MMQVDQAQAFRRAVVTGGLHLPQDNAYAPDRFVQLDADDTDALAAHLQRLGKQGRFFRFHNAVNDEQIQAHCAGIDWDWSSVTGWFDETEALRGCCFVAAGPGSSVGEFGLTVEQPYRRLGIGMGLLERGIEVAPGLGITRLFGIIHPSNVSMLNLADRLGFRFNFEIDAHELILRRQAEETYSAAA